MRRKWIGFLLVMLAGLSVLAGCQGAARSPQVFVEGAAETAAAATAFYASETATAAAALTPTAVMTPYVRPTDHPGVDPDAVIASVAGHDITVSEFRSRVRYERWYALDRLASNIAIANLTLDALADPQNTMVQTVIGVLYTLSMPETFAESVLMQMVRERVMHQEYLDRGLSPNTGLYNNLWMNLIGVETEGTGELVDGFDAARDAYMARLAPYTDISLADLNFKMMVRSEQQTLLDAVGAEADIEPRALDVRHILLASEDEAQEVLGLLADGADFAALARERSLDISARGNAGDLGFFKRGVMTAPFEEAAFSAAVGEIVGPVQTAFGYHIIEVLDQEPAYAVRRIVVETEVEAQSVLQRLESGEDFAALVEAVSSHPEDGGALGYYGPDTVPPAWEALIFEASVGDVVGPVQTADGYNIFEITDEQVYRVHARHILVATEDEALAVLERLNSGEDFAAVAADVSIDAGAQPNDGNLGFLTSDQMPDAFARAVYAAAVGEIVGPIETDYGFHVVEVLDSKLNMLSPNQYDEVKALHFQNWLRDEVREVAIHEIWRQVVPADPAPEDISPLLGNFEAAMNEALAAMAETQAQE